MIGVMFVSFIKSMDEVETLTELIFQDALIDETYMDTEYNRQRIKTAILDLDEKDYLYIKSKFMST